MTEESKLQLKNLDGGHGDALSKNASSEQEEAKDDFVIVDNSYLDSFSEVHPLSNLSDFTRVNTSTA